MAKELGDVLWYLAQLATELELDLDEIAAGEPREAALAPAPRACCPAAATSAER